MDSLRIFFPTLLISPNDQKIQIHIMRLRRDSGNTYSVVVSSKICRETIQFANLWIDWIFFYPLALVCGLCTAWYPMSLFFFLISSQMIRERERWLLLFNCVQCTSTYKPVLRIVCHFFTLCLIELLNNKRWIRLEIFFVVIFEEKWILALGHFLTKRKVRLNCLHQQWIRFWILNFSG